MDVEALVLRVVRGAVARFKYRLPIRTAAVGANGAVLFTAFSSAPITAARGSITQTHITGEIPEEGFQAPVHIMVTDATGRATVAMFRGAGEPTFQEDLPRT